jgi:adenine-specific DNA-methyltransferase
MIYPRLKLARNLLRDDGIIFISIDNSEVSNLEKLCAEVFGTQNIVSLIANVNNPKGRSDDKFIATAHEHVLVVAKDILSLRTFGFEPPDNVTRRYNKTDGAGDLFREIDLRKTGDNDRREDRPNLFYYFYFNQTTGELYPSRSESIPQGYIQIAPFRDSGEEGNWRWGLETSKSNVQKLTAKFMPNRKIWGVAEKDLLADRDYVKPTSAWTFKEVNSERGSEQFVELGFEKEVFLRPKPSGLIEKILEFGTSRTDIQDIILDFFAGSGTTGQAVLSRNAIDGANRRFILVQVPETLSPDLPVQRKAIELCDALGRPRTIAEVTKERIRRAAKLVVSEHPKFVGDVGFRVLKTDSSNMLDVYYTPDTVAQTDLLGQVDNIRTDRSPEDLLFQVFVDWGLDLALPIAEEKIEGKQVFFVDTNALAACFDVGVTDEMVKAIAQLKPLRAVFRDSSYGTDSVKINVEQIFKLLSPETEVRSI